HDGRFSEIALQAGVAVSEDGKAEAGMGTDAADIDGDGWSDVFITHLDLEHARLYRNLSGGAFLEAPFPAQLRYPPFPYTGFCPLFIDFHNHGAPPTLLSHRRTLSHT